jgi:outer membrane immunogenic protein
MRGVIAITLGIAIGAGVSQAAFAADKPLAAYKAPRSAASAHNWSGCHAGGNVGWIRGDDRFDRAPAGIYLQPAAIAAPPNAFGTGLLPGDFNAVVHSDAASASSVAGGVQVGCDRQINNAVIGVEVDFNLSGLRTAIDRAYAAQTSENPTFTIASETERLSNRLDWFSTFRARLGYAHDRLLFYVTGGAALGNFYSETNIAFAPGGALTVYPGAQHVGSHKVTRVGYTVGGGIEYAWKDNWSFKAEYLYLDFGTWSYISPLVAPAGVAPGYSWITGVRAREHFVRLGVNYQFGKIDLFN